MTEVITVLGLLAVGLFAGRQAEKKHYRSIRKREQRFLRQPALTVKQWGSGAVQDVALVSGSVVVSVDYFKRFLMSFRLVFGGEVKSYSPLIDRGRREAILRMKEQRPNASMFVNLRVETSTISNGSGRSMGTVEVVAYATAITLADGHEVHPQAA